MADARPRPMVAGNWKMNGLKSSVSTLQAIFEGLDEPTVAKVELVICPPATLIAALVGVSADSPVAIGGQDCHAEPSGAFTGDISAEMLADVGATAVIVGHSERRTGHMENDPLVLAKARAARRAGLTPIVCVGETRAQRDAARTLEVVGGQLAASIPDEEGPLVVAYEPVWAIGTGLTPTSNDVREVHAFLREQLVDRFGPRGRSVRLLYGGSVKPSNAKELLAVTNVDGALVGGASLVAQDFLAIAKACR